MAHRKPIDYINVVIPEPIERNIDHSNYNTNQRRAEMTQSLLTKGILPMSQRKLAKLYGIKPPQIGKDKGFIMDYIYRNYWEGTRVVSTVIAAKMASLRGSLEEKNWGLADRISNSIIELAFNMGLIRRTPEEINITERDEELLKDVLDKKKKMVEVVRAV